MNTNHHTPPRFAASVLAWLLADDWETPAGDFEEYYNQLADSVGVRTANRWYRRQVLGLLPERLIEKTFWAMIMFFSNLKVAIRTLQRHKLYAVISIGGLSVGIAACILIVLFIQDELAFDRQHDNSDRIARVVEARTTADGDEQHFVYTLGPLGEAMVEEIPGVIMSVKAVTSWAVGRQTIQFANNRFYEAEYLYTDNDFFKLFNYNWLAGNPDEALSGPNMAVLTESVARKYFGAVDPVGKVFNVERDGDFTVSGLIEDPPSNSHLPISMVLSLDTYRTNDQWKAYMADWESSHFLTYVLLEEGAEFKTVAAGLDNVFASHVSEETLRSRTPTLQPLTDIHFGSSHIDFDVNRGRAEASTMYMFAIIAVFIVLIACINYTNMATASSLQRAKEVGLRKSVGANKNQLVRQFLSESILTTFAALLISLVLAWTALPLFNDVAGKHLILSISGSSGLLLTLFALLVIVGILSGSYPAFLLSRYDPAIVLKGRVSLKSGASRIRQVLVVAQFSLSIGLIIASLVVSKQLNYVQEMPLGFNENQLIIVDINDGNSRANFKSMKSDILSDPTVMAVSVSSNVPGDWKNISQVDVEAIENSPGHLITSHFLGVDENFLETYEIELLAVCRTFGSRVS